MASTAVYAWTPFDILTLAYTTVRFSVTESIPEEITITSKGRGNSQEEAVQAANVGSVQRAIGMLVVSEQTVQNDKVVRNLAASYSSGVVNSYTIDTCEKDKFYTCTVTAKVSPWKFMRKLQGDSQTLQVSGNDLYMQHETAKTVMLQRAKMTRYYFSQIRQSGLDAKIKELRIEPTTGEKATVVIDYEVKWNPEFKKEMIRYLEKLQADTANIREGGQVYIQWGPTGFFENRVWIYPNDPALQTYMAQSMYAPTYLRIKEFGECFQIDHDEDVFKIDWYGVRKQRRIEVDVSKLKALQSVSVGITPSCVL